jgi:hypothetical protein
MLYLESRKSFPLKLFNSNVSVERKWFLCVTRHPTDTDTSNNLGLGYEGQSSPPPEPFCCLHGSISLLIHSALVPILSLIPN